jgi:hypothetical protein
MPTPRKRCLQQFLSLQHWANRRYASAPAPSGSSQPLLQTLWFLTMLKLPVSVRLIREIHEELLDSRLDQAQPSEPCSISSAICGR